MNIFKKHFKKICAVFLVSLVVSTPATFTESAPKNRPMTTAEVRAAEAEKENAPASAQEKTAKNSPQAPDKNSQVKTSNSSQEKPSPEQRKKLLTAAELKAAEVEREYSSTATQEKTAKDTQEKTATASQEKPANKPQEKPVSKPQEKRMTTAELRAAAAEQENSQTASQQPQFTDEQIYKGEAIEGVSVAVPLASGHAQVRFTVAGGNLKVRGGYDFITVLDSAFRKAYPKLSDLLLHYSDKERSQVMRDIADFEDMALSFSEKESHVYYSESSVKVRRADTKAISLLSLGSSYTGGAHGDYGVKATNFDVAQSRELKLTDVCTDVTKLLDRANRKLTAIYDGRRFQGKDEYFAEAKSTDGKDLNWSLEADGVMLWFNPYAIAPYSDGILCVKVPFFGNSDIFNPYYSLRPADSYAVEVSQPLDYAFKSDGTFKRLEYYEQNMGHAYSPLILINDRQYLDETVVADKLAPVFVHLEGVGANYLYLFTERSNQSKLSIYSLDGDVPVKVKDYEGVRRIKVYDDLEDVTLYELCTKPEAMLLEVLDLKTGIFNRRYYTVGADGRLYTIDKALPKEGALAK